MLLAGFGLGLSLIIAIGAQNVFVLRQGIRREHVFAVVIVCAVSDAVLIAAGIAGIGAVLTAIPWLVEVVRWVGAAFLVGYGMLAARRAWRPRAALVVDEVNPAPTRLRTVVLTALALTWLNPHVYLDTVFLLGSIGGTYGEARWLFGAGAMVASVAWFTALGFGARYLSRWLSTPRAWRWLDAGIAVVMVAIGLSLVLVR